MPEQTTPPALPNQNTPGGSSFRHFVVFLATRQLLATALHYGVGVDPQAVSDATEFLVDGVGAILAGGGGWIWSRLRGAAPAAPKVP